MAALLNSLMAMNTNKLTSGVEIENYTGLIKHSEIIKTASIIQRNKCIQPGIEA